MTFMDLATDALAAQSQHRNSVCEIYGSGD